MAVGDRDEEYLRTLQLLGWSATDRSMLVRPLPMRAALQASADSLSHPWGSRWGSTFRSGDGGFFLHDLQLAGIYQHTYPDSRNDGALTAGRYLTTAARLGATYRAGPLTVSLRPMVAWVQNGDFALAPVDPPGGEYGYPWGLVDAPQRFGPDSYTLVDWGQSEIRLAAGPVTVAFGTTNLWWGPGLRNAILMSNNAAGFPHASLATARPVGVGIGTLEGQWIFGHLQGSDWFESPRSDQGRYLTGAALAFSPAGSVFEGLTLGAARVFYAQVPEGGIDLGEYFLIFQTPIKDDLVTPENPEGTDLRDQLFSLFARWVFPESGFEVYGEWARNDHATDFEGYVLVLGNTQAFTLGLQKAIGLSGNRILRLTAELTQLDNPADRRVYGAQASYYVHHLVPRGYTQRGQFIGAAIGPGSMSQYLGATLYTSWGGFSVWAERYIRDKDAWIRRAVADQPGFIDGQLTLGTGATWFQGAWDLRGQLEVTHRYNQNMIGDDTQNLRASVEARWRLGARDGR